jgi:type IV secretory pathway VirJ component
MKLFTMAAAALSFLTRTDALTLNAAPVAVFPDFVASTGSTHTNNTNGEYDHCVDNEIDLNSVLAGLAAVTAAALAADLVTVSTKTNKKETVAVTADKTAEAAAPVQSVVQPVVTPVVAALVQPVAPVFTMTMNQQAITEANRRMAVAPQTIIDAEAARQASKKNAPQEQIREGAAHNYCRAS